MNIYEAEEKQNQLLYLENAANRVKRNGKMIFPLISFTRLVHYYRRRDERNKKGCSEVSRGVSLPADSNKIRMFGNCRYDDSRHM